MKKALIPQDLPYIRRAAEVEHRRSLMRCISAVALGALNRCSAENIIRETWPTDATAAVLTRNAVLPTMTTDGLPTFTAVRVLPSLAPSSAAVRLFERAGLKLDFEGVHQYSVPYSGSMPSPFFVAEGVPAPVVMGDLDAMIVGPTAKMMFITGISGTLESYSVEAASGIITSMMTDSASKALDAAVFSNVAADAARPAGILYGVSAQTPVAGGGLAALVGDLKNLIGGIADAGLNADDAVIIAHPTQAVSLRLLASPTFAHPIFSTTAVAAGTVIAIEPNALATGYGGQPEIYTTKNAVVHLEGATPLQIGSVGSPPVVASPTLSAFQHDLLLLKLRTRCAWAVRPGAVQVVNLVTW